MTIAERWLLPDGMQDLLPSQAHQLEQLRRRLIDSWQLCGYDYVVPPTAEFIESLLSGTSRDLDGHTFRVMDPLTGRQMGIVADLTQQIARIDAHAHAREGVARYCYAAPVLRTQPQGALGLRHLMQAGCELFGHNSIMADAEVIVLLLNSLVAEGASNLTLDLGHVGVHKKLLALADLSPAESLALNDMLRRRAVPELNAWQAGRNEACQALAQLHQLAGGMDVLSKLQQLAEQFPSLQSCYQRLHNVAMALKPQLGQGVNLHIDLAEVRGLSYHSGLVFSVFAANMGQPIAEGGRYDNTGEVYGRARPATGFSIDIRALASLILRPDARAAERILAPQDDCPELARLIHELRAQGQTVVPDLQATDVNLAHYTHQIVKRAQAWQVQALLPAERQSTDG